MKLSNYLLLILTTIIVVLLFMVKCEHKPVKPIHDKSDSLMALNVKLKDSISIHSKNEKRLDSLSKIARIEYGYLRGKVITNPCDSVAVIQLVQKCDTIIYRDSSQIVMLKSVNHLQAEVINNLDRVVLIKDSIISNKSDSIQVLTKKNKRIKKTRLLVAFGSFILGNAVSRYLR